MKLLIQKKLLFNRFLFLIINFNIIFAFSQNNIRVVYNEFINIQIPTIRENVLYGDLKNNITYFSSNISHQTSDLDKEKEIMGKETVNSNIVASIGRIIDNDYIIIDLDAKKIELIEDHGKKVFQVEDTFLDKPWVLLNEKKQIHGYDTFKATVHLRGVDWEVWYAPDLPYPYGPWKLNGLPGLILEAKTSDGFFTFKASLIEFDTDKKINVPYNKIYKRITFKEYLEYQDTLYNMLFLDIKHEPRDIFSKSKERNFETRANLSWL